MRYYDENFDTDFTNIEVNPIIVGIVIMLFIIVLCIIAC